MPQGRAQVVGSAAPGSPCGRWARTGRTRRTSSGSRSGSRYPAGSGSQERSSTATRGWPLWVVAALIDVVGPRALFWVPGMGPTDPSTWAVRGRPHGRAGVAVPDHQPGRVDHRHRDRVRGDSSSSVTTVLPFLAAFVSTVLMWLLYFDRSERRRPSTSRPRRTRG